MRPDLTSVRRAVGVAVVFFLLGGAVAFYREAPGFPASGSGQVGTTASSSASAAPTRVGTRTASPGGMPSSAGPSRARPGPPTSTPTLGAGDSAGSGSAEEATIQVVTPAAPARPFQTVPIHGTYHGGADRFLWVQRWEKVRWRAFPLPAKTDQSGQFTAYVELGEPGLYWLRVLDPGSRVRSKQFLLVIKG